MAIAGDELGHAYAQALYGRYYPNIYRYALSQLRSAEDAEDAAQNTFLRAFAALQKGVVPESEAAWLFKIAHNVCASSKLAWLRRRRVESPRDLDELQVARPESDVDISGLDDALAAMPPRLREAFLLREWQGLSYAEIAERLDTSQSAVETLIFRARRHLATELRKAQQALTLGPLAVWLRGFFGGGGGGALRAAGVLALATGVVATSVAPAPKHTPARARPQRARADVLLPTATPTAARTPQVRTAILKTPAAVAGAAAPATDPALPAVAPTATAGATDVPAAATTGSAPAAPAPTPPSTPTAALPDGRVIPTGSAQPVTVPTVTVPALTTPVLTTPSLTTPSLTTPSLTTPSVTTPQETVSSPLP